MWGMHCSTPDTQAKTVQAVARCAGADPEVQWLARMGVVAVDESGTWKMTAFGRAAMARFHMSSHASAQHSGPAALANGSLPRPRQFTLTT
jgi:hypothetical protein